MLKKLKLGTQHLTKVEIGSLTSLTYLNLQHASVTIDSLPPRLRSLGLGVGVIIKNGSLRSCPDLRRLVLNHTHLPETELLSLTGLTHLHVNSCLLFPITGATLSRLTSLTRLGIGSVLQGFGDAEVAALTGLRALSLKTNLVTDAGLWSLLQLTHLRYHMHASVKITREGLRQLTALRRLEIVDRSVLALVGNTSDPRLLLDPPDFPPTDPTKIFDDSW
jgi:hypothetical protein